MNKEKIEKAINAAKHISSEADEYLHDDKYVDNDFVQLAQDEAEVILVILRSLAEPEPPKSEPGEFVKGIRHLLDTGSYAGGCPETLVRKALTCIDGLCAENKSLTKQLAAKDKIIEELDDALKKLATKAAETGGLSYKDVQQANIENWKTQCYYDMKNELEHRTILFLRANRDIERLERRLQAANNVNKQLSKEALETEKRCETCTHWATHGWCNRKTLGFPMRANYSCDDWKPKQPKSETEKRLKEKNANSQI